MGSETFSRWQETGRFLDGHDLYVTDARYAADQLAPRVLLRCARCGCLGVGMIDTQEDREYAATKDRDFDTGEWWDFERLRIIGSAAATCQRGTA